MSTPGPTPALHSAALPVRHGFFTREGGVSAGPYDSLNASASSADDPGAVAENRARIARALGAEPSRLLGLRQVHGADVVTVIKPWAAGAGPRADAMVTRLPGLALGIVTADCAPVLLADGSAGVVGAVHAGWRSAVGGVLEATIAAMAALGADARRIAAAIGPCIRQPSYEVGADLRGALGADGEPFLQPGARPGHWQFDLPGYCAMRLRDVGGVGVVDVVDADTLPDPRFWSHRRRTLAGGGPIGHQMSAIVL